MRICTPSDLGLLVRARRRRMGLRQQELADRLGVTRQWIADVERGEPGAEVEAALRALLLLGVSLAADGPDDAAEPEAPLSEVDIDELIERSR